MKISSVLALIRSIYYGYTQHQLTARDYYSDGWKDALNCLSGLLEDIEESGDGEDDDRSDDWNDYI